MVVSITTQQPISGTPESTSTFGIPVFVDLTALASAVNSPPMCIVRNSGTQSIPNITFTALSFDVEEYDVFGMHSPSVNPSRITVPVSGYYQLDGLAVFASSVTGRRLAHYSVNGATIPTGDAAVPAVASGGGNTGVTLPSRTQFMVAGDYAEIFAFHDSGGALNAAVQCYFSARYVATGP